MVSGDRRVVLGIELFARGHGKFSRWLLNSFLTTHVGFYDKPEQKRKVESNLLNMCEGIRKLFRDRYLCVVFFIQAPISKGRDSKSSLQSLDV